MDIALAQQFPHSTRFSDKEYHCSSKASRREALQGEEPMEALHRVQFPLESVLGLIQQGAGDGYLRVCEHRIPPHLLLLHPAPPPLAIGCPAVAVT